MQTEQSISIEQLHEVVRAVYDQGEVAVKQAYSDFDCPTRCFLDAAALIADMDYELGKEDFFDYLIYYPASRGYILEERIDLDPGVCNGHEFRFSQQGWGLIQLQCGFRAFPKISCRIAVNSETRAQNWSDTYVDLKDPALWNWQVVRKKAGRLTRLLRKLGKEARDA